MAVAPIIFFKFDALFISILFLMIIAPPRSTGAESSPAASLGGSKQDYNYSSSEIYLAKEEISIRSAMGVDSAVTFSCRANRKGADTQIRVLKNFEHYEWTVGFNEGGPELVYTCTFGVANPNVHGTFQIFNSTTDYRSVRCYNDICLWKLFPEGLATYISDAHTGYKILYNWTPN